MLDILGLRKEYFRGTRLFEAVRGATMSVRKGDFVCIIGQSRSGKSTLLNIIAGLLEPTSGSIVFEGRALTDMKNDELSLYRNKRIGYIPQGHSLLPDLSVIDNVLLPYRLYKGASAGERSGFKRAMALLERVEIAHLAEAYPASLSGGEIRRATVARSLINSPRMLVADELPTVLDSGSSDAAMSILSDIARDGVPVILAAREESASRWANRRFSMQAGVLTEIFTKDLL
jgi:putative ABC transport system ATP-binding protein